MTKRKVSKKNQRTTKRTRTKRVPNTQKIVVTIDDDKVRSATQEVFEHYRTLVTSTTESLDDYSALRGFVGGICAMSKVNTL